MWGLWEEGGDVAVQLFVIRDGNVVDRRELFWEKVAGYQPGYFLSEVLQRYYQDNMFIPAEILIPFLVTRQLIAGAGKILKTELRARDASREKKSA